ncbi:MAG: hypothetical protein Q8896_12565 [Bacteroidota bacterium]|nr:hypothetical protein [Bacteroidota bacterium]
MLNSHTSIPSSVRAFTAFCLLCLLSFSNHVECLEAQTTVQIFNGNPGQEIHLMASGMLTTGEICPQPQWYPSTSTVFTTDAAAITVDNIFDALAYNQIVVYSPNHPPTLKRGFSWCSFGSTSTVSVPLASPVPLKLKFYMITSKTDKTGLLAATTTALATFVNEHTGISTILPTFSQITSNPIRKKYNFFSGSQNDAASLYNSLHPAARDTLAVFVVDTILANQYEGFTFWVTDPVTSATVPMILVTYNAPSTVLEHEIGHAFGLSHVDLDWRIPSFKYGFNNQNMMYSRSLYRGSYLTEGQIFRAYYGEFTFWRILSLPMIPSMLDAGDKLYPPLNKRVYYDGALAP